MTSLLYPQQLARNYAILNEDKTRERWFVVISHTDSRLAPTRNP